MELKHAGKILLGAKFKGVFGQDEVPPLKKGELAISNNLFINDPRGGEHWVGLVGLGDRILMFDSFARSPSKLLPYLSSKYKMVSEDPADKNQREIETSCGQLSLGFLIFYRDYGLKNALLI